jgi:DNA-binding winged helix-turn-helix (wHTH) protein/Tol biopolymer transport system component
LPVHKRESRPKEQVQRHAAEHQTEQQVVAIRHFAEANDDTDRGDGGASDDFFLAHAWMHARRSVSRMDRTKFTWERSRGSSSIGPPLICRESQYRDVVRLDCAADQRSQVHCKSITPQVHHIEPGGPPRYTPPQFRFNSGSIVVESPLLYEFGPFTVQPAERLLVRGGRPVALTPKAFDLLIQLVDRPGQLVGKNELMAALWPDTFVEEANLAYTMSALRKALGDGQNGEQYIQTVPTRGYRFIAPLTTREPPSVASERAAPVLTRRPRRFSIMVLAAALIAALGGLAIARWVPWTNAPSPLPLRLSAELGVDATLPTTDAPFALSADGALLAFAARKGEGDTQLYVRRLSDQLTATALPGTEGASSPFFSPDGHWVAFFADLKLKKVPVTGGAVVPLAEALNERGGWWAEDGTIVFSPATRRSLMRVSATGGSAHPLTTLVDAEISHRFPQVLPGGHAVLYTASTKVNIGAGAMLVVQPLPSGERVVIQRDGFFGRYTPSGHIVYVQDDALFAIPFDGQRLEVTGPPGLVIDGVRSDGSKGSAQFAVSQMGTLAYLTGKNLFGPRPIAWMDRNGMLSTLRATPADWSNPEFSPDRQRIAMDIRREGHSDIWVYEWARDTPTRVTTEKTHEEHPIWTPDGRHIVYGSVASSMDPAGYTLAVKGADGTGKAQVLLRNKGALEPGSWHPTPERARVCRGERRDWR